jgi:hypothetical protein
MDTNIAIGIALIVVGGVLIFLGLRSSKRFTVQANGGSIAVGGNNSGPIINTNVHAAPLHTVLVGVG